MSRSAAVLLVLLLLPLGAAKPEPFDEEEDHAWLYRGQTLEWGMDGCTGTLAEDVRKGVARLQEAVIDAGIGLRFEEAAAVGQVPSLDAFAAPGAGELLVATVTKAAGVDILVGCLDGTVYGGSREHVYIDVASGPDACEGPDRRVSPSDLRITPFDPIAPGSSHEPGSRVVDGQDDLDHTADAEALHAGPGHVGWRDVDGDRNLSAPDTLILHREHRTSDAPRPPSLGDIRLYRGDGPFGSRIRSEDADRYDRVVPVSGVVWPGFSVIRHDPDPEACGDERFFLRVLGDTMPDAAQIQARDIDLATGRMVVPGDPELEAAPETVDEAYADGLDLVHTTQRGLTDAATDFTYPQLRRVHRSGAWHIDGAVVLLSKDHVRPASECHDPKPIGHDLRQVSVANGMLKAAGLGANSDDPTDYFSKSIVAENVSCSAWWEPTADRLAPQTADRLRAVWGPPPEPTLGSRVMASVADDAAWWIGGPLLLLAAVLALVLVLKSRRRPRGGRDSGIVKGDGTVVADRSVRVGSFRVGEADKPRHRKADLSGAPDEAGVGATWAFPENPEDEEGAAAQEEASGAAATLPPAGQATFKVAADGDPGATPPQDRTTRAGRKTREP